MQHTQGKSVSIVIADDHPIVRKGLREILEDERSFQITAECENGVEALECIRAHQPDVAIIDIDMPEMSGLDVAAVVNRDRLDTAMLILTITDSAEMFNQAMEYGVTGYVLKDAAVTDLVQGVRKVLRGEYFFSSSMASKALLEQRRQNNAPTIPSRFSELTPSERKILRFIGEDKTTSEIANILSISTRTVDTHRAHISQKLDLRGSYALVRFALQNRHLL